jgi:hypothetical protein
MLRVKETVYGVLEAALKEVLITFERHQPTDLHSRFERQVEAVDAVEKQQRAHLMVQIVALMSELLQLRAFAQQVRQGGVSAEFVQRQIA